MANKLGLTNEIKELKLGKSFGKGENQSFHTFRYDFMPASVDTSKRAAVDIGEGNQVMVTVPHMEGSGTASTVFKGSKKPYQKECVLIIDHTTGEITLEKLSYNVQLKKTRAEGSSKIKSSVENNYPSKKSPSNHKLSPHQKACSTFGRSSPNQKCSPIPKSPIGSHPSPNGNSNSSMPCLSTLSLSKPPVIPEVPNFSVSNEVEMAGAAPEVGVLSSSSSSESSSGESDSGSSDHEDMSPAPKNPLQGSFNSLSPQRKDKPNTYSPNSFSMPTAMSLPGKPAAIVSPTLPSMPSTNHSLSMPSANSSLSMPSTNTSLSMPKFSLLSEDLQLSESDSDQSD